MSLIDELLDVERETRPRARRHVAVHARLAHHAVHARLRPGQPDREDACNVRWSCNVVEKNRTTGLRLQTEPECVSNDNNYFLSFDDKNMMIRF